VKRVPNARYAVDCVCAQSSMVSTYVLLLAAVLLAVVGHQAAASPLGVKLAAVAQAGAVATSADTTAEMKQHAVSAQSDAGKRSSPLLGLQSMPGFPGMGGGATTGGADGADGGKGKINYLDENDPAAALTKIIAPQDVPKTYENGTIIEDTGLIGADGKRQGKLAPPPDFTIPAVFAGVTGVIMLIYFSYECCIKKEEPRKKSDSYM